MENENKLWPWPGKLVMGIRQGHWVLLATILASSMAFIDGTVVNVILPILQKQLSASVSQLQWIVETYALFLAALILLGGALGDYYGRRRIFTLGLFIFIVASFGCGMAQTIEQMIWARGLQGLGGALMVPGSLAIITAFFSEEERGKAIGIWSGFSALTAAIGPVLGGYLAEEFSWRLVFFINIPIGLLVILVVAAKVPESVNRQSKRGLDYWGAFLITCGLGLVVYVLIELSNHSLLETRMQVMLGVGILCLLLFIHCEIKVKNPMVPLHLFRNPTFLGANLLTLFLYFALSAVLFFLPFNLQQLQGYSATEAGAVFLPFVLIMFLLSRWAGGLVDKYGAKKPLVIGPIISGIGFLGFALPGIGGSFWQTFFLPVVVLSFGMALTVAPLTTAVMNAHDQNYAGLASGINNAVSRTAGLLAIAVMGVIMVKLFAIPLKEKLALLDLPQQTVDIIYQQQNRLAEIGKPDQMAPPLWAKVKWAIHESFLFGFRGVVYIGSGAAFLSALMAFVMIESKTR